MKLQMLVGTALAIAGATFLAPAKAEAQTICDFDVPVSLTSAGQPVLGASGSYHVVITNTGGNNYTVTVTGNNDGNPPESAVPGDPGPTPGSPIPKSGIGKLSFNFFDTNQALINTTPGANPGDATNTVYAGPAGGNLGGPNNVAFGTAAGTLGAGWSASGGSTLFWNASNESFFVAPHGGNSFTGNFSLAAPLSSLSKVTVSLQDSGQQWSGECLVVPEPSALVMALSGLGPLGLLIRRRKLGNPVSETEEDQTV